MYGVREMLHGLGLDALQAALLGGFRKDRVLPNKEAPRMMRGASLLSKSVQTYRNRGKKKQTLHLLTSHQTGIYRTNLNKSGTAFAPNVRTPILYIALA